MECSICSSKTDLICCDICDQNGCRSHYISKNKVIKHCLFCKRGFTVSFMIDNFPTPSKGLQNLGNTCFMNGSLQSLMKTPLSLMSLEDVVNDRYTQLVSEWIKLCNAPSGFFLPNDFLNAFTKEVEYFSGGEQHDSNEFITFFLDTLHEATNKKIEISINPDLNESQKAWVRYLSNNNSVVSRSFAGMYKTEILCGCGYLEVVYDPFTNLILDIDKENPTLKGCFDHLKKPEQVVWKCVKCGESTGLKKTKIDRYPETLMIVFKKFIEIGGRYYKRNLSIDFEEIIYPDKKKYELKSIVHHFGLISSGHVVASVKQKGRWYLFDDAAVHPKELDKKDSYIVTYLST